MADERRRWGKAGQRLTPEQVQANRHRAGLALIRDRAEEDAAKRLWAAGLVRPWRITMMLNANMLYGPEVDEACGAREPDVDLWEAGKLYPSWEQLKLLAELTGCTPRFFCVEEPMLAVEATSMRFHMSPAQLREVQAEQWVDKFDPAVVAAAVT